jgi:hypothetical protein
MDSGDHFYDSAIMQVRFDLNLPVKQVRSSDVQSSQGMRWCIAIRIGWIIFVFLAAKNNLCFGSMVLRLMQLRLESE